MSQNFPRIIEQQLRHEITRGESIEVVKMRVRASYAMHWKSGSGLGCCHAVLVPIFFLQMFFEVTHEAHKFRESTSIKFRRKISNQPSRSTLQGPRTGTEPGWNNLTKGIPGRPWSLGPPW
jgi:hypothetical protein